MKDPVSQKASGGRIPQQFIDELVARADIVELIGSRVPLRQAGRNFVACCPFHNEKTPSFTVSPEKQFYHCFGCGAHGTAIGFLMAYDRMEFLDAVHELAGRLNMEVPVDSAAREPRYEALQELLGRVAEFYRGKLSEHANALDYLRRRGVDDKTAAEFQIGYAPPGWDQVLRAFGDAARRADLITAGLLVEREGGKLYDRFRDRLMFPIHDTRGRVIGFGGRVLGDGTPKYLNSPETPIFQKGRTLYGRYQVRKAMSRLDRVLVVEGYMDVVGLAQHGVRYAVATLGTSTTSEHVGQLLRMSPGVVFCFDGDDAGRQAAWRALESVLPRLRDGHQVSFMFLPEGEDPDTLVRAIGRAGFEGLIGQATPLSVFFFDTLMQKVDMRSVDGRARLVELARPLLSNLSPGVFRQMMFDRLGEVASVGSAQLSRLIGGESEPSRRTSTPVPKRTVPSLVRRALGLLLHRPSLAARAGSLERLCELEVPGVALLVEILELLLAQPKLSMSGLSERWRGTEAGELLDRLLAQKPPVALETIPEDIETEEGIEAEFVGALQGLRIEAIEQRMEVLYARCALLAPDERRKLQPELQQLDRDKLALQQSLSTQGRPAH